MLKRFCSPLYRSVSLAISGLLLGLVPAISASAQVPTRLDRQLSRLDLAVSGTDTFTKGVSGTNYLGEAVTDNPGSTLGALVQVRYTKSPLVGFEGTYSYARFTQDYTITDFPQSPFGVQANASEYSLGYVAHLPSLFGFRTFAGGGAGSIAFRPTTSGGLGLPSRARAAYYYDLGAEDELTPHFGVRVQFRQLFYKAPDFGANYLTINKQTITSEPTVGLYLKF
jgi:hypothetical protein